MRISDWSSDVCSSDLSGIHRRAEGRHPVLEDRPPGWFRSFPCVIAAGDMMVKSARIAIIGGGLSGLYAAALLEERGIKDYVVLEARETFGGRIISVPDVSGPGWDKVGGRLVTGSFDLGATWFWPEEQPELQRLVDRLGLQTVRSEERRVGNECVSTWISRW